jgi:sigma-B regulation protein RsbQ
VRISQRDGVNLAHEDSKEGSSPMLFIHGWGCDHSVFAPQVEFFRTRHRVVSVDLRGHGSSDAPRQEYTMAGFAEDLVWLCTELNLVKPILVATVWAVTSHWSSLPVIRSCLRLGC